MKNDTQAKALCTTNIGYYKLNCGLMDQIQVRWGGGEEGEGLSYVGCNERAKVWDFTSLSDAVSKKCTVEPLSVDSPYSWYNAEV